MERLELEKRVENNQKLLSRKILKWAQTMHGKRRVPLTCADTWGQGGPELWRGPCLGLWVCDPAAYRTCADVWGSCCHQRLCRCPGLGSTPGAMCVFQGYAANVSILIYETCTAKQDHGDIWARATSEDHVWVCGSITAAVSIEIDDP